MLISTAPDTRLHARNLPLPPGVSLEIVERPAQRIEARVPSADTLDPLSLLHQYFTFRDKATDKLAGPAADNATRVAAETVLQEAIHSAPSRTQTSRDIVFESVELHGFGSFGFERAIRYPLHSRGVVLVMGRNEDESSADSNGSGKTTLAMAALWALTGSADVRADGKRLGRKDVVHALGSLSSDPPSKRAQPPGKHHQDDEAHHHRSDDEDVSMADAQLDAKDAQVDTNGAPVRRRNSSTSRTSSASVCLRGTLDGKAFEVRRRMSAGKSEATGHSLRLCLDGKDITQSSLRDTQAELERMLPVSVLADAVFHGQHLVTGLLEKTDKDFKSALDNIIPTDVWAQAQERARERRKEARATREQLVGRILEKDDQQVPLDAALSDSLSRFDSWHREHVQQGAAMTEHLQRLQDAARADTLTLPQCRALLLSTQETKLQHQGELDSLLDPMAAARTAGDARRVALESHVKVAQEAAAIGKSRVALISARKQELHRVRQREADAISRISSLELTGKTWKQEQKLRVSTASHALNGALATCHELRAGAAESQALQASLRLPLVKALNASIQEMESGAVQVAANDEGASAAKTRCAQYAALQHDPTCRLCLQPIDNHTHAQHLREMTHEMTQRQHLLASSRLQLHEAQGRRRHATQLLDVHDEVAYTHRCLVCMA